MLDFNATHDETHGQQQLAGPDGFYDTHFYVPRTAMAKRCS